MKPYEYTWMWEVKEGVVKAYEFFLDTARSLGKHVVNSEFAWVGVCAGPKLCVGVLPGVDPAYALELTGLSPNDVSIQPNTPRPTILPLTHCKGGTMDTCGFRTQRYRPVIAGVDIGSWNRNWGVVIRGCSIGFFASRGSDVGIITNNHCTVYSMCNGGGYYVTQPGSICGGTQQDKIGENPVYKDYDGGQWLVDSAWVKLEVPYELAVLDEGGAKREPQGSARDPQPGETVVKFGRGGLHLLHPARPGQGDRGAGRRKRGLRHILLRGPDPHVVYAVAWGLRLRALQRQNGTRWAGLRG